jgi:hypothetical protein
LLLIEIVSVNCTLKRAKPKFERTQKQKISFLFFNFDFPKYANGLLMNRVLSKMTRRFNTLPVHSLTCLRSVASFASGFSYEGIISLYFCFHSGKAALCGKHRFSKPDMINTTVEAPRGAAMLPRAEVTTSVPISSTPSFFYLSSAPVHDKFILCLLKLGYHQRLHSPAYLFVSHT